MSDTITRAEAARLLGGYTPDAHAEVRRLRAAITAAHDLAHRLAVSRGIAGTRGEAALFDVRDVLSAALRGEEAP